MTPSPGFVQTLQNMDSLLSVHWGNHIGQWVVARKAVLRDEELRFLKRRAERLSRSIQSGDKRPSTLSTYKGVVEELRCAEGGKRVVCFAPELNDKLYNSLCLSDIKRYGGYSRMADEIERKEAFDEADQERQEGNTRNAINKETYDILSFLQRKRSDALANGERDLKKLLGTQHIWA